MGGNVYRYYYDINIAPGNFIANLKGGNLSFKCVDWRCPDMRILNF